MQLSLVCIGYGIQSPSGPLPHPQSPPLSPRISIGKWHVKVALVREILSVMLTVLSGSGELRHRRDFERSPFVRKHLLFRWEIKWSGHFKFSFYLNINVPYSFITLVPCPLIKYVVCLWKKVCCSIWRKLLILYTNEKRSCTPYASCYARSQSSSSFFEH